MLPGIRAVISAIFAAAALLAASLAVVAIVQVARDDRGTVLRADLTQRIAFNPAVSGPVLITDLPRRTTPVIDSPDPEPEPVAALPEPQPAQTVEVKPDPVVELASAEPSPLVIAPEPPMGGPSPGEISAEAGKRALRNAALKKANAAALEKKKARAQRQARERRTAARRAAQARPAAKQQPFGGSFSGSFGNTETTGSINRSGAPGNGNF